MNGIFYGILIALAGVLYASAFVSSVLSGAEKNSKGDGKLAFSFVIAGFIFHTVAQALPLISEFRAPVENPFEVLESAAWFFVGFEILWRIVMKVRFLGVFSMLPAAILVLLPTFCPTFWTTTSLESTGSLLASYHAAFAAASISLTFLTAAFAPMYLLQKRALSEKRHWGFAPRLPSIETISKCMKVSLALAATLMGISIVLGATAISEVELNAAKGVKFFCATLVFFWQTALAVSYRRGYVSGEMAAKLSIALFIFAMLCLAPILALSFY